MSYSRVLKLKWKDRFDFLRYLLTKPSGPIGVMTTYDANRFGYSKHKGAPPKRSFTCKEAESFIASGVGLNCGLNHNGGQRLTAHSDSTPVVDATTPFKERDFWKFYHHAPIPGSTPAGMDAQD